MNSRKREIEYPQEYMEVMASMYSNGASISNIRKVLASMFPKISAPSVYIIKSHMTHLFGERVSSTTGTGRRLYSLMLCDEVVDFIESLPLATDKGELINSILLMFVRQYNLRKSRVENENEERIRMIEELNRRFSMTHVIPIRK